MYLKTQPGIPKTFFTMLEDLRGQAVLHRGQSQGALRIVRVHGCLQAPGQLLKSAPSLQLSHQVDKETRDCLRGGGLSVRAHTALRQSRHICSDPNFTLIHVIKAEAPQRQQLGLWFPISSGHFLTVQSGFLLCNPVHTHKFTHTGIQGSSWTWGSDQLKAVTVPRGQNLLLWNWVAEMRGNFFPHRL